MKQFFSIIFLISIVINVVAGDVKTPIDKDSKLVYGKIVDKISGEEIAGAAIKINDQIVYSDLSGNFSISIPALKTEAVVTFVSYNDTKINIDNFSYTAIVVELESK
jgi:CarboxypepD_reg-like domain